VNFGPSAPPEIGKVRPGVIVSNSVQNEHLDSVVVVPLSTRAPEIWPLRVEVKSKGLKLSYAVVPAVRQVSKARLQGHIVQLPDSMVERVGEAIALYLSD
jgi:mRNA interferase MazF